MPEVSGARTLRSLVVDLYDVIQEKRAQGVSWPTIHKAISGHFPIGLRTLMLYFGEEERERKRRAVADAYEKIAKMRDGGTGWNAIQAALPQIGLNTKTLREYFTAEQRERKAAAAK